MCVLCRASIIAQVTSVLVAARDLARPVVQGHAVLRRAALRTPARHHTPQPRQWHAHRRGALSPTNLFTLSPRTKNIRVAATWLIVQALSHMASGHCHVRLGTRRLCLNFELILLYRHDRLNHNRIRPPSYYCFRGVDHVDHSING